VKSYSRSNVADEVLLRNCALRHVHDRTNIAELLADIGEIEARSLHLKAGYKSLHAFCMAEYALSDDEALLRINVARTAREYPAIFHAIADGKLSMTTVLTLKRLLTAATANALLAAAAGKSKAEIQQLIADRQPRLDVPASVQPLPARHNVSESSGFVVPERQDEPRPKVEPLAPQKFRAEFTMTQEMHDDLLYAQALDNHAVPLGDISKIFHRALRSHIARMEKQKFAATSKPRPGRTSINPRTIPADVKRQVVERDQGRCAYVSASGRRCDAIHRLEFDHIEPVARNGAATVANIRLLCRAHNQLAADETFGAEFMEAKRRAAADSSTDNSRRREDTDVIPWLRALGVRPEEARRAAEHCASIPNAPLEERVRFALTFCGPRGARKVPAPTAITAPAMGSAA